MPPRARLASFQEPPEPEATESRPPDEGKLEPGEEERDATKPVQATPDVVVPYGYTMPGLAYRQLAVAVAAAVTTTTEPSDELGKELSESVAMSDMGTIGRIGLTAPPTRLAGRVTSRPGLQDGPATGLGFSAPDRNIFAPQLNPLSGSGGRCGELAGAGFFSGSRGACEQSFRR